MKEKKNKKILCVSVMESWGGGELFLYDLVNNIEGYEFFIASPPGIAYNKLLKSKARLIKIDNLKKFYRKQDKWLLKDKLRIPFQIKLTAAKLIKNILSNKIDLIIANGNFAALYAFPAARLTKRKFIIVQHLLYEKNSIEAKVTSFIGQRADMLACVSNAVASRTRAILNNNGNGNIVVIRNGMQLPDITERSTRETINIGVVGSIIYAKGIDLIIKAAKPLLLENENLRLHIFGAPVNDEESLKYYNELKALIDDKLKDKIVFHGHVESKEEIYNTIDIAVNFSRVPESLSYSTMEAMAYGKLVIGANAGGITELITDKQTGFLVKPNDVEQLTSTLRHCIDKFYSEEIKIIKENARKHIKENFSLDKFRDDYEKLFRSLLK